MKKLVITLVAVFALGMFSASAQGEMAHINYIKVMEAMDTYQKATEQQKSIEATAEESAKFLQEKLQADYAIYEATVASMSNIERELAESNLQTLQGKLQGVEQTYTQQMQIIQERYYVPLEKWLKEAVGVVGEAKKIDYILYYDEQNSIFWVNPNKGLDLTQEVITEMLKLEAASPVLAPGE